MRKKRWGARNSPEDKRTHFFSRRCVIGVLVGPNEGAGQNYLRLDSARQCSTLLDTARGVWERRSNKEGPLWTNFLFKENSGSTRVLDLLHDARICRAHLRALSTVCPHHTSPSARWATHPVAMGRCSRRKIALSRAMWHAQSLTALVCLELGGFTPGESLGMCGLRGILLSVLLLLYARQTLRTLLQNRYLYVSHSSTPKSRQWGWHTLHELSEQQWRVFTRMGRSTYAHLTQLLAAQHTALPDRLQRRPCVPQDTRQKDVLFRLGHDGNSARELQFLFQYFYFSRESSRLPSGC